MLRVCGFICGGLWWGGILDGLVLGGLDLWPWHAVCCQEGDEFLFCEGEA